MKPILAILTLLTVGCAEADLTAPDYTGLEQEECMLLYSQAQDDTLNVLNRSLSKSQREKLKNLRIETCI